MSQLLKDRILRYTTRSPYETMELGEKMASGLSRGDVVALLGELGSGKTQLIKGIARGLGVKGYVKSPSFTLVNIYEGAKFPLYHIDLYRIGSLEELDEIGIEEYIYGDGVCVIEWADKILHILPEGSIVIKLHYIGENERFIEIEKKCKDFHKQ